MKKILLVIGLLVAFGLGALVWFYQNDAVSKPTAAEIPAIPTVSAQQAILIDGKTGECLYEKNADEKGYPASTTKIMTAMVVMDICREQNISLKEKITVPKEAEGVEGSSLFLKAGEEKTIEELLYGIMLVSGNDGATALASQMGGKVEYFVDRMNEKAEKLGCMGTHFENPTGLFSENHYTTARDLANIARHAMKNDEFAKIAGTENWKSYYNKNKTVHQYEGGNGVKIGYTRNSGRTLVASAERDGTLLICVLLSDGNWFNDAYSLMDYGFKVEGCRDE
ncbi:MAG: D-alanyl-D-alanine carboxypeptidase family protein [Emergencia sp.]